MNERQKKNYIESIIPIIRDEKVADGINRSYLWKVDSKRNIYLYLQMRIKEINNQQVLFTTTNLDSEEVRGQGKYIWKFLKKELQKVSDGAVSQFGEMKVLHQVSPNQYSRYLPEEDSDYQEKDGKFYAGFMPS